MENFPNEVIESILKFTSISSRRTCRSVCCKWKAEMDRVGHSVVIDDREDGVLDFIQKIVIKELNIKYLESKDSDWLNLCLDDVKTLIFTGYVNPDFITTNLLQGNHWQQLKKLFFYGSSLISQPFLSSGDRMKVIHCSLPNLKELHIVLPLGVTLQAVEQFSHGVSTNQYSLPPGIEAEPNEYFDYILDERAIKNIRYLFKCISGPNLKTLFFAPGPRSAFDPNHLFKFVVKHTTEDFDGVRFLKEMDHLEELKLTKIRRTGIMKSRRHVFEFIRSSRFHRKLNVFHIDFQFEKALIPDIGGNWNEIDRIEEFKEPSRMLFQVMHPIAGLEELEENAWWTVESMYFGGTMPENVFAGCIDFGFERENEESTVTYLRNYLDVIDKGLTPFSIESNQPFDLDWSQKSYSIYGGGDHEECWGCDRTPLRTISACSTDYHEVYNKCGVDQGLSRIVLLVNKRVVLEQMKKTIMRRMMNALDLADGSNSSGSEAESDDEPDGECFNDAHENEAKNVQLSSEFNQLNLETEESIASIPNADEELSPESQEEFQNDIRSNTVVAMPVPPELDSMVAGTGETTPSVLVSKTTCFILSAESMPHII